jgi:hypothetical protein
MLPLVARDSTAAPLSQAASVTIRAAATLSSIEQVHGCHLGPVARWGGAVRLHGMRSRLRAGMLLTAVHAQSCPAGSPRQF